MAESRANKVPRSAFGFFSSWFRTGKWKVEVCGSLAPLEHWFLGDLENVSWSCEVLDVRYQFISIHKIREMLYNIIEMCKYMYIRYSKKKTPFSRAKGVLYTYLHIKKFIYIYILAPPRDVPARCQHLHARHEPSNLPASQYTTLCQQAMPSDRFAYRRTQVELRAKEWWGSEEVAGR